MGPKNYNVEPPEWDHGIKELPEHLKDGGETWYHGEDGFNLGRAQVYSRQGYQGGPLDIAWVKGPWSKKATRERTRLISQAPKLLVALMHEHGWNDPQHLDAMPDCPTCKAIRECFEPETLTV